jgi:zinc/manganese transport system permease protein
MSDFIVFDPLFRVPFFTGLCLSVVLALVGAYLRMREEWLAAFGLSHIAAAGGIAALPLGLPGMLCATLAAGLAALLKGLMPRASNSHYALMILIGWSAALLLAANTYQGEVVGEALMRGQLYFTSISHLTAALVLLVVLLAGLPWLSSRLLVGRFFPDWFSANQRPAWRHEVPFGILVVAAAVLGTVSMGAVTAFAMLFVPPWVAFVVVNGWRRALWLSVGVAVGAYVVAFVLAAVADQPFGPVLTACLALIAALRLLSGRMLGLHASWAAAARRGGELP